MVGARAETARGAYLVVNSVSTGAVFGGLLGLEAKPGLRPEAALGRPHILCRARRHHIFSSLACTVPGRSQASGGERKWRRELLLLYRGPLRRSTDLGQVSSLSATGERGLPAASAGLLQSASLANAPLLSQLGRRCTPASWAPTLATGSSFRGPCAPSLPSSLFLVQNRWSIPVIFVLYGTRVVWSWSRRSLIFERNWKF